MAEIEVEYCVPCGLLDRALEVERAVLEEYGDTVDGFRLKPGDGGVFRVEVDGEAVYDKEDEGFDLDDVLARVGERV